MSRFENHGIPIRVDSNNDDEIGKLILHTVRGWGGGGTHPQSHKCIQGCVALQG